MTKTIASGASPTDNFMALLSPEAIAKVRQARAAATPAATAAWYVVVVPDSGDSYVVQVETAEAVQTKLIELDGTDSAAYVFFGYRAKFTKKPFRKLLLPDGRALPLYAEPETQEAVDDGFLGDAEVSLTPVPSAEEEGEYDVDEYDDDEDAESFNDDDVSDEEPL